MQPRQIILSNRDYLAELKNQHTYLELSTTVLERVADSIRQVNEKLSAEELKLALVGGFSAGKSTLINALLGEKLLTSRINPTTICPTYIRDGTRPGVQLTLGAASPKAHAETQASLRVEIELLGKTMPLNAITPDFFKGSGLVHRRGEYEYHLLLAGERHQTKRLSVPLDGYQVSFYYNLLTDEVNTSLNCFEIPEAKLPRVRLSGKRHKGQWTLRDLFLTGMYQASIRLPAGDYQLDIAFDSDWFAQNYPMLPYPRELRSWWQRLWVKFRPNYAIEWRKTTATKANSIEVTIPPNEPKSVVVEFDPLRGTFGIVDGIKSTFKRRFSVVTEGDKKVVPEIISTYTATSRAGDQRDYFGLVTRVDVEYPSPLLRGQLTIVDTPGIGAEHEHSAITLDILKNTADACLFLYPADQAGTMSDLTFIREHVDNLSGLVLFCVTKIDLAGDTDEVQEILEIIEEKIVDQTGIKDPNVFALSPLKALEDPQSEEGKVFAHYMQMITELMMENKEAILVRSLLKVQKTVMQEIKTSAKNKENEYDATLRELRKYVIEDLESFVNKQKPGLYRSLEERFERDHYVDRFSNRLYEVARVHKGIIKEAIDSAENKSELRTICEGRIPSLMGNFNRAFAAVYSERSADFNRRLAALAREAFADFEASFEKKYSLARLEGKSVLSIDRFMSGHSFGSSSAIATTLQAIETSESAVGWGMGLGAVIGTFAMPVIGTIIGGVIGTVLGDFLGPSLDRMKKDAYLDIARGIDAQLEKDILPNVARMVDQQHSKLGDAVVDMVNRYLNEYSAVVDQMIADHRAKEAEVADYIARTGQVVKNLEARRQELEKLDVQLRDAMVVKQDEYFRSEVVAV